MKNFLLLKLFPLLFCINIYAQGINDSLDFIITDKINRFLLTNFDKQLNTFQLNSSFIYIEKFDKLHLNISENFNSTFINTADKNIRDEQDFSLKSSYEVTPNLSSGIQIRSNILSDNRRIELNQASVANAVLFTRFSPAEKIFIAPFAGYSSNRQIGEIDNGLIYGAEGSIRNIEVSDFNLFSELKFRNEDIFPRRNLRRYFNLAVISDVDNNVINRITMGYSGNKKDYYLEADSMLSRQFNIKNNIFSRSENNYIIQDHLRANNFIDIFSASFLGGVSFREIERDRKYRLALNPSTSDFDNIVDELSINLESSISYNSSFFYGTFRINFSERNEKHIIKNIEGIDRRFFEEASNNESRKNNSSARTSVSVSGGFNFSQTDKLYISLYQNKLIYDTPSPDNFDDRDEILSIIRLRYTKTLTPFFEAFVNAEGTINHTVYIFSEKSSNNNINRVLKLTTGGVYRGKNISSLNSFEVTANYTIYDFEDLIPNFNSFAFRQYTAVDSTELKITDNISLELYGYLKLSELGDLNWKSFSVKPIRFLEEIYAEPKLSLKNHFIRLSVGLRYFALNTYNYREGKKEIDSDYLSVGPLTKILLIINKKLYLNIHGWYEFITINEIPRNDQANLNMQLIWNF